MKPKKAKSKIAPKNFFTPTQGGALIENFKSEFKIFGEKIESVESKIDVIAANQAHTLERVTAIEIKITALKIGQNKLIKNVDALDKRVAVIEKEIKEIKDALKVKIDAAEFKILESRVSMLERKIETLLVK